MTAVVSGTGRSWRDTGTRMLDYRMNQMHRSVESDDPFPKKAKLRVNPPSSPVMVIYFLPV
jgi:hypothetical protein